MTWRKYFTPVPVGGELSPLSSSKGSKAGPARSNYSSYLPDVYSGSPNRIERYQQYEVMDSDPEINAALDILAEFCTQKLKDGKSPFTVQWRNKATNAEVRILGEYLQQWGKLQKFDTRIFRIMRNTFKYGDAFFIRDPENQKWNYVDPTKVTKVIINESEGKKPEQYVIKDLAPNFMNLVATQITPNITTNQSNGAVITASAYIGSGGQSRGSSGPYPQSGTGSRFGMGETEYAIDAEHIIHLSLSEGLDNNYPFGNSLLENIFKVYKQKELLEDAILIYRIQRAPERRVFHIDVGNMPGHMAMAFVERVKNEIHQRRIPSQSGGGQNVIDSAYNPLSISEDYFFPQTAEGRGSKVETLPGGCFSMDTMIPLLDGRTLSIFDISVELSKEKEIWVYSCEPKTGKIVPGLVTWAGVTQKSAKVMKILLDNGEEIICTPDHKFPQYGEDFKRADQFKVGDSLIPLYRNKKTEKNKLAGYEEFFDNDCKEWIYTHRMIAEYFKDSLCKYHVYDEKSSNGRYEVRHHKNFNRYDNSPSNLCWMAWDDHKKLHRDFSFSPESQKLGTIAARERLMYLKKYNHEEYIKHCSNQAKNTTIWHASLSKIEKDSISKKQSLAQKNYIKNLSEEQRTNRNKLCKNKFKIASKIKLQKMSENSEYRQWVCDQQKNGWTAELRKNRSEFISKRNYNDWANNLSRHIVMKELRSITYSHNMLREVINMVHGKTSHEVTIKDITHMLNVREDLLTELQDLNKNKKIRNWSIDKGFTSTGLVSMVKQFGYSDWSDFRKKESVHNHRIVDIVYLDEPIEVGTLTIDGDELYHNYHTFALAAGVFTKNSNLGEIDDLKFFTNKLFRGLRIPSSYLPTGADDSQASYNDGRVGTAYIQELRFNKYCERLQSLITAVFDEEFKMYMYTRGVNIDANLFELKFNPPLNFASTRQSQLDSERINTFSTIQAIPFVSNRFALKRFLGLTDEEIAENERLWSEENGKGLPTSTDAAGELRSAGLSAAGIEGDLGAAADLSAPADLEGMTEPGEEGMGSMPVSGTGSPTSSQLA